MSELAKQLHELSIQFEIAEKDGKPVIDLANQISALRDRIAALQREQAILQPPTINREADGDILWA